MNVRSISRNQNLNINKEIPGEQLILEIHQMISSIPEINEDEILQILDSIFIFIIQFEYNFFDSLSPDEVSILLDLVSYKDTKIGSTISSRAIDLFTFILKNDQKLIEDFIKLEITPLLLSNMENTTNSFYYTSCISFFYEQLKIDNGLRDDFVSLELPQFIIDNCSPYPDKIFFEFLTFLTLKPEYLPELAGNIIASFITQEVPQERTITVIRCLISLIREDETLIIPIISSEFLERLVSSLGSVSHTIAIFLKFSTIALQINQPEILDAFLQIGIFEILQSSLELVDRKEISFTDMLISTMKSDRLERKVASANDKLLKYSSNLMRVMLQFDSCLSELEFASDFNYIKAISEGLPYKTVEAIIDFLLSYSIRMPISISKKVINEEFIRNTFSFASSSITSTEEIADKENQYVMALAAILTKYSEDEEITDLIRNINDEFENVIID